MIKYKPTIFRTHFNVRHNSPLRAVMLLCACSVLLLIVIYVMLGLFIEKTAYSMTLQQEHWLWSHRDTGYDTTMPPKTKKFGRMRKRLEKVFLHIPQQFVPKQYAISVELDYNEAANAYAMPDGALVVTSGLMEMLPDDQALTFVLGHELGHLQYKHNLVSLERMLVLTMFTKYLFGRGMMSGFFAKMTAMFDLQYSRHQELEADRWGLKILRHNYGTYYGARVFFEKLYQKYKGPRWKEFLSTHPASLTRIKHIDKVLMRMQHRDRNAARN